MSGLLWFGVRTLPQYTCQVKKVQWLLWFMFPFHVAMYLSERVYVLTNILTQGYNLLTDKYLKKWCAYINYLQYSSCCSDLSFTQYTRNQFVLSWKINDYILRWAKYFLISCCLASGYYLMKFVLALSVGFWCCCTVYISHFSSLWNIITRAKDLLL